MSYLYGANNYPLEAMNGREFHYIALCTPELVTTHTFKRVKGTRAGKLLPMDTPHELITWEDLAKAKKSLYTLLETVWDEMGPGDYVLTVRTVNKHDVVYKVAVAIGNKRQA